MCVCFIWFAKNFTQDKFYFFLDFRTIFNCPYEFSSLKFLEYLLFKNSPFRDNLNFLSTENK